MEACNAWAKSHGVDAHKHGVEFRASPLGGLGAFATKAINAGDTLLLLPRGFAVTPYVCEVALQDASLARSPRAALALLLRHALVALFQSHPTRLTPGATERDCLNAYRRLLGDDARVTYLGDLIRQWTRIAWAHQPVTPEQARQLLRRWQQLSSAEAAS